MILWDTILEIKKKLKEQEGKCDIISVKVAEKIELAFDQIIDDATFTVDFSGQNNSSIYSSLFKIDTRGQLNLSPADINFLEMYLPYALLPYYSKKHAKCYAISHFAQTLDGKIASCSGDSKWIGNEENLIHAHRMRALCDAILIGANTLDRDDPSLNVRLVAGADPVKVIVGGDNLSVDQYKAVDSSTILFCRNQAETKLLAEKVVLEQKPLFDTKNILDTLHAKGLHSVYIEGGAFTTSNFLKQGQIDQVQIHISPQILGSGTDSFCFDGIVNMEQSIKFSSPKFVPFGGDVMFIGNLL